MRISIIVPAYNEEMRLTRSLPRLVETLSCFPDTEVIVVDDGSQDGTSSVAAEHLSGPLAKVMRLPWQSGKGAAVRMGVSVATGEVVVFMDADLATDLRDLPKLLKDLDDAEVVVGSRTLSGAVVTDRSGLRALASRAFSGFIIRQVGLPVSDPQCGFKAFRAPVAKLLFGMSRTDGFAFDVEILALANLLGFRVIEIPVRWQAVEGSKVRVGLDSLLMIRDVVRLGSRMRSVRSRLSEGRPFTVAVASTGTRDADGSPRKRGC